MFFTAMFLISPMIGGLKRKFMGDNRNKYPQPVETTTRKTSKRRDDEMTTATQSVDQTQNDKKPDDINRFYEFELHKTIWKLPKQYQNLSHVGAGAFGQVCSATDTDKERTVAVKKLSRPFQTFEHAKRTYREIKLLTFLSHDNVIDLLNVYTPAPSYEQFQDVYLVFSYIGSDLNTHIRAQSLEVDQVQLILYQVLRALKYVHSAGIIHRDLKPSNIVVSPEAEVKLIDFGLARLGEEEMTGYVATRYYRAPEIMLNWMHYGQTADIWSVGCIMAEMLTGRTLFPGTGHIDQLKRTLTLLGTPTPQLLKKMTSEYGRQYIESLPPTPKREFKEIFPKIDTEALDLMEKMLCLDPDVRVTAAQALAHPFFAMLSDPLDEPSAPRVFTDPEEESDSRDTEFWRKLVYDLIVNRQTGITTPENETCTDTNVDTCGSDVTKLSDSVIKSNDRLSLEQKPN